MIDTSSIQKFAASLRELPKTVVLEIAAASAPALTEAARATFSAGTDAFGGAWKPSYKGAQVTLTRSGALANGIRFVAIGSIVRIVLGMPYAKYQIGRRPIFPKKGESLPPAWRKILNDTATRVLAAKARPR